MTHIYLAFQKGQRRRIEWLTRFVTRSIYCHVEVFETSGPLRAGDVLTMWSSDSWTGCVRPRTEVYDPDFWDVVHVPWAPPDGIRRVEALDGCPYDKKALFFTQFINLRLSNAGQYICTAVAGEAIGLVNPERYSPQELKDAVEHMNRVYLQGQLRGLALAPRVRRAAKRRPSRAPARPAHISAEARRERAMRRDPNPGTSTSATAGAAALMPAGVPAPPPP